MPVDPELAELMTDTMRWRNRDGTDAYNEPSFGVWNDASCSWQQERRAVRNEEGVEVISSHQLYLDDVYNIDHSAEVELPDGTVGAPIVRVDRFRDENGDYAQVVYLASPRRTG